MIVKIKTARHSMEIYPIFIFDAEYDKDTVIFETGLKLFELFDNNEESEMLKSIINHARNECDFGDEMSDRDVLEFIVENEAYIDYEIES